MSEPTPGFRTEDFRAYLRVLARVQLARAGPVRKKLDGSDLVQDVLLQAHVSRAQFRGTTAAELAAWLRRILANKLADAERRYGRKKRDAALEVSFRETIEDSASRMVLLPAAEQTSPSGYVARREHGVLLAAALESLPEDQRTAVELHYVGGNTLAELAEYMQRTKPSVAGLLRRGLKALRDNLDPADHGQVRDR